MSQMGINGCRGQSCRPRAPKKNTIAYMSIEYVTKLKNNSYFWKKCGKMSTTKTLLKRALFIIPKVNRIHEFYFKYFYTKGL